MTELICFKTDDFSTEVTCINADEIAILRFHAAYEMSGNITSVGPSRFWGIFIGKKTTKHETWTVPATLTITLKRGREIYITGSEATRVAETFKVPAQ